MAILAGLAIIMGPMWVAKIYVAPYWVSIFVFFSCVCISCSNLMYNATYMCSDFCDVVGFGDLPSPPWPSRESSMVQGSGNVFYDEFRSTCDLPVLNGKLSLQ